MRFRRVLTSLVAALVAACSSANDGGPNGYGVIDTPAQSDGNTPSTWTEVYTGIIQPTCSGCHNPGGLGGTSGKLDMSSQDTAYANLVNAPASGSACAGKGTRVTPSNAATSIMYQKVSPADPAPCGSKMPFGGAALPQDEVDEIASWINAGAMNN
jgi:hypothetical protein